MSTNRCSELIRWRLRERKTLKQTSHVTKVGNTFCCTGPAVLSSYSVFHHGLWPHLFMAVYSESPLNIQKCDKHYYWCASKRKLIRSCLHLLQWSSSMWACLKTSLTDLKCSQHNYLGGSVLLLHREKKNQDCHRPNREHADFLLWNVQVLKSLWFTEASKTRPVHVSKTDTSAYGTFPVPSFQASFTLVRCQNMGIYWGAWRVSLCVLDRSGWIGFP